MENLQKAKELSKGYRELADIIDEMVAFEESGIEDENKQAELLGRFMMKTISIQKLAD